MPFTKCFGCKKMIASDKIKQHKKTCLKVSIKKRQKNKKKNE